MEHIIPPLTICEGMMKIILKEAFSLRAEDGERENILWILARKNLGEKLFRKLFRSFLLKQVREN